MLRKAISLSVGMGVAAAVVLASATAAQAAVDTLDVPIRYPSAVVVDSDGTLYATDQGDDVVWRVTDPGTSSQTATSIPVGVRPTDIAVGLDGTVYTAGLEGITRIADPGSGDQSISMIEVDSRSLFDDASVAVAPDGTVYTLDDGDQALLRITDAGSSAPTISSIPLGTDLLRSVAVGPDGTVYVAEERNGRVARITAPGSSNQEISDIPVTRSPTDVVVAADGTVYVVDQYENAVMRIANPGTSAQTSSVTPVGQRPLSVAVAPDGTVYTANTYGASVTRILRMGTSGETVSSIPVGVNPESVAVAPDGTAYVTVRAESRIARITFSAAPYFPGATPVPGRVGEPYSYTVTASGTPSPTYALAAGDSLPPGLTLDEATGVISGTPTTEGTTSFRVVATNSEGAATTDALEIVVEPAFAAPVFTASSPATDGQVGTAYSYTFAATGNPTPTFSVVSGALPAGVTLDPASGVLSGVPTVPGTSSFTVGAANGIAPAATTQELAVTITGAPTAPSFSSGSTPPVAGTVGTAYTYRFTADGFPAPVFALRSGNLPAGLTLAADGTLSGTPTTAGSSTFRVSASNGVGQPAVSEAITINVAPAAVMEPPTSTPSPTPVPTPEPTLTPAPTPVPLPTPTGAPTAGGADGSSPGADSGSGQLAWTGADGPELTVAGGAAALLAASGIGLLVLRRRRASARRG